MSEAEAAQAREAHGVYFTEFLATCEIESARERLKEALEKWTRKLRISARVGSGGTTATRA